VRYIEMPAVALTMRRSAVIAGVLLVLALVVLGATSLFAPPSTEEVAPEEDESPELVTFADSQSGFWAYLNARESFEQRSPINVVVRGDADEVVRIMREDTDTEWSETDEEHEDAGPGAILDRGLDDEERTAEEDLYVTETGWGTAAGTTRYAYVDPGDGSGGQWVTETLQIDDGDYYGQRYHIRLYESPDPDDEWVAMQAHTEHFDWFTLRHRVDGVEEAQTYVESDFMGQPFVDNVWRMYLDNQGPSDSDGWATVVELAAVVPLLVVGRFARPLSERLTRTDRRRIEAARERIELRHIALAATVAGLLLGVRAAGIALERHTGLGVYTIAALLYPVVAVGIPVATYAIASGLERRMDSAVAAATGLAVGILVDYSYLGVDVLPVDVVVQRATLIVTLGLIAGGAARRATRESRWNDMLLVGVGVWVLLLLVTLLGYV
jgi:hypothetical protein